MAQLVERALRVREVPGSNPGTPTNLNFYFRFNEYRLGVELDPKLVRISILDELI